MKNYLVYIVGAILAIGLIFWLSGAKSGPGELDTFASCLTEKGAVFYGAFWCPHCANQKALFGKSISKINYVECSTADGKGQLAVCKDKGVTNYPTWFFADNSTSTGELSLEFLSEKTSCALTRDIPTN